ncbi:MAG: ATP-binding protein [bacterium]|nr:ATP-binding protein [bacterium]
MTIEQTFEKLAAMKFSGMYAALERWWNERSKSPANALDPEELVGLLTDAEWTARENRKLTSRLRRARFPMRARVEEVNYRHPRGLRKQVMLDLVSCRWIAARQNLIISGATGLGKSWLPCALGEKACRDGYSVLYTRCPTIFEELRRAHADGTYANVLKRIAKTHLLIIDDFGSTALEPRERRDLREILEGRYAASSTIVTSQLEPKHWHSFIGDDTVADAICDRLVHNAHRLELAGESMRKLRGLDDSDSDNNES